MFTLICLVILPTASFAIYSPHHPTMEKAFKEAFSQFEHAAELCSYGNLDQDIVKEVKDSLSLAEASLKKVEHVTYAYTHTRMHKVLKNIQKVRFSVFVDQNMPAAEKILRASTKIMDSLIYDLMTLE